MEPFWTLLRRLKRVPSSSKLQWSEYHVSFKAGPQKGPAVLGSLSELASLPGSLIDSLKEVGGEEFSVFIEGSLDSLPIFSGIKTNLYKISPGPIRRIVGIQDKEGKTRSIAILDYWSQTVLRPLHLWIFRLLRKIPQDMTFHQGRFTEHIRMWGEGAVLYSVDLSAATDRFPITLIESVLKGVFPESYVSS